MCYNVKFPPLVNSRLIIELLLFFVNFLSTFQPSPPTQLDPELYALEEELLKHQFYGVTNPHDASSH